MTPDVACAAIDQIVVDLLPILARRFPEEFQDILSASKAEIADLGQTLLPPDRAYKKQVTKAKILLLESAINLQGNGETGR